MNRGIIASRYATALLDFATKQGKEMEVYDNCVTLCQCFLDYPALERVLSNLLLEQEKKVEIIALLCGEKVSPEFEQFTRVVIQQHREGFLLAMCLHYQQLMFDRKNLLSVKLTTAIAIDEQLQAAIKQKIEVLTEKTVVLRPEVDSAIVGGYIVQWDTYRYDASVKSTLRRIEKSLIV